MGRLHINNKTLQFTTSYIKTYIRADIQNHTITTDKTQNTKQTEEVVILKKRGSPFPLSISPPDYATK